MHSTPLPLISLLVLCGSVLGSAPTALGAPEEGPPPAPERTPPQDPSPAPPDVAPRPPGVQAEKSEPAGAPAGPSEEAPVGRGLSWDVMYGGVPSAGGALVEAKLGFSGLPLLGYHFSVADDLSIGGLVGFDYAYWAPSAAFAPSLLLQVPLRFAARRSEGMTLGLRADPGAGFFFEGGPRGAFQAALLLNVGASLGFALQSRFIAGGGIDIPAVLVLGGGDVVFALPILLGPTFEFHVTPPLALTVDLKFGPHISTNDTVFGLRVMAGIGYRL